MMSYHPLAVLLVALIVSLNLGGCPGTTGRDGAVNTSQALPGQSDRTTIPRGDTLSLAVTVIRISDGDTLSVRDEAGGQHRVRLAEIDAPEDGQPWGAKARRALARLAPRGESLTITLSDTDRYGRWVAHAQLPDGRSLSHEMVAEGNAWVYRQYAKDQQLFLLEENARRAGLGLWSLPQAEIEPPWQWRRHRRERASP